MYVFKLKLKNEFVLSTCSFSFPTLSVFKDGNRGIKLYNPKKTHLGRFKAKKESVAIKQFVSLLQYNIRDIKSPFQKANSRTQNRPYAPVSTINHDVENMIFLLELLEETEEKYLDKYPEAFL